MQKHVLTFLLTLGAGTMTANAQEVNRMLYQDFQPVTDYIYSPSQVIRKADGVEPQTRPDHVNNADTKFFPPVFNQSGGSCGSASNEGYNLTYEINSLLDRDGKLEENQFPSHWVYLLSYQTSEREEILRVSGVPSVATYGGRTYSKVFGEQDCSDNFSGRMQGYDKWLSAMNNRVLRSARLRHDLACEEGREELKQWLWNHQGDTAFLSGGIACVGVAITGCKTATIPNRKANITARAYGKQIITSWGETYDHSVTIVGYDDRIEYDLDKNGKITDDEKGAWIICNSWGSGWANKGFVYCPYKIGYSVLTNKIPMTPYFWLVRKYYQPKRVLRITMDYSRRSEIQLLAGVSENLSATKPDYTVAIPMFNYDGNPSKESPAPEVPMLGKWADGKMHTEPIEFAFDVTDLTEKVDKAKPLKYFLQVNTKSGAIGSGNIRELCLMNYEQGSVADTIVGLELGSDPIQIKNAGKSTYATVQVQGLGNFRPASLACKAGVMTWKAPTESEGFTLQQYLIYKNGTLADSVSATELTYTLPNEKEEEYLQVSALYTDAQGQRIESKRTDIVSNIVLKTTTKATLSCNLDALYMAYLRDMATNGRLATLDLGDAHIVEGGEDLCDGTYTSADELASQAFFQSKLRSITLPKSLISIGSQALGKCNQLTAVVIPDEVISIGMDAMAYCGSLSKVTFGSKVSNLGQGICYSSPVKTVYVKALTPPSLGTYTFSSNPTIHVYSDVLEDYQASAWASYGTIVGDLEDFIPREETAIHRVEADDPSAIYDLNGRRVHYPIRHGLYIRNGKKILF